MKDLSSTLPFIGQLNEHFSPNKFTLLDKGFDLLNRKITYLLYENARYSPTQLAKILKVNRETVLYRLQKMRADGILNGFVTLINHEKMHLREYRIFFKLKIVGEEKEFIVCLAEMESVVTINICAGAYDLVVAFWVANDQEFLLDFQKMIDKHHGVITHFDIVVGLERDLIGGMKYLLSEKELLQIPKIKPHKDSTFSKEIILATEKKYFPDVIDRKILRVINLHADISIGDLAKELSLSSFIVKKRMEGMVQAKVIRHFFPVVSIAKLGYHWWYVLIKCTKLNHVKFLTYLQMHPNIPWYIRLLGKYDYSLSLYARDNAECHKVLAELRKTFSENILYYDVLVVFSQLKYVQRIPQLPSS